MKYIRTKNNEIYKTVGEEELYWVIKDSDIYEKLVPKCNVIKQADTIEELCDCFIIERTNGEHIMFKELPPLQRHYDLYCREYHHIAGRYGCIWVAGKGLKYVAKMNEKGEFELL